MRRCIPQKPEGTGLITSTACSNASDLDRKSVSFIDDCKVHTIWNEYVCLYKKCKQV